MVTALLISVLTIAVGVLVDVLGPWGVKCFSEPALKQNEVIGGLTYQLSTTWVAQPRSDRR
jgi:hypothetical protein